MASLAFLYVILSFNCFSIHLHSYCSKLSFDFVFYCSLGVPIYLHCSFREIQVTLDPLNCILIWFYYFPLMCRRRRYPQLTIPRRRAHLAMPLNRMFWNHCISKLRMKIIYQRMTVLLQLPILLKHLLVLKEENWKVFLISSRGGLWDCTSCGFRRFRSRVFGFFQKIVLVFGSTIFNGQPVLAFFRIL